MRGVVLSVLLLATAAVAAASPHPVSRSLREMRPSVAADSEVSGGRPPASPPLPEGEGERFARLALACIDREFPNKPEHVLDSAADAKVPRDFHPAFFGCYEWHSSVHGHWMLVRLLKTLPDLASGKEIRRRLDAHFRPEAMATEA